MQAPPKSSIISTDKFTNPSLPAQFMAMIVISWVLLLFVGGSLFFFPSFARAHWMWPLTPFNTNFLGAVYLSAWVPLTVVLWIRRWAPARLILPMLWVVTTFILIVSFSHAEQFALSRRVTGIWYWLYLVDCLGATYYLGKFHNRPPASPSRVGKRWVLVLRVQWITLGGFGVGLLGMPTLFNQFWPWPLDLFHCQLYSSIFIAGAVGSWVLQRAATSVELLTMGLTQVTFSLLVLIGMTVVDASVHKIQWLQAGTLFWLSSFVVLGFIGMMMIRQSFKVAK